MVKTILFTLILCINYIQANSSLSSYKTKLEKVTPNYLYIKDNKKVLLGSSGIIIHHFDNEHQTIISSASVVMKKNGYAILKYEPFNALEQNALPSYKIKPQIGDEVILNYLYNRALAITPDRETYRYITQKFSSIDWLHPDIFASKLAIDYSPIPSKSDFKDECKKDDFALLFFAVKRYGYFVDCNTFKLLYKTELPQTTSKPKQKPFYSRIKDIKGRMFNLMGGNGIKNYDRYYTHLLGL